MMSVIGVDEVNHLESDNVCFRRKKYLIHKSFRKLNLPVGEPGKEKPEMISDIP